MGKGEWPIADESIVQSEGIEDFGQPPLRARRVKENGEVFLHEGDGPLDHYGNCVTSSGDGLEEC